MAELHPLAWGLLGLGGAAGLVFLLGSAWLCTCLLVLSLFTGILTALPIGFTLKGPQIFALLGLGALGLQALRQSRWPDFPWHWLWPFALFILSMLPSLLMLDHSEAITSLRLLFNYLWLQLIFILLLHEARSLKRIRHLLLLGFVSGAASLLFGYGQQLAFYLGVYDPLQFVGRHSSLVDFYGPFLRLSPGTFANEYGEILQTLGILLLGWLYLLPQRPRQYRGLLQGLLGAVILGLVLNFTRASWLVFVIGSTFLLAQAQLRLRTWLGLSLGSGLLLGALFYLSQQVLQASLLLSLGQRFQELGQIRTASAGTRLQAWAEAWEAFLNSPWIGQGWGHFVETHNVPLQLLAETGVLGFTGFYLLMIWCSLVMWRALQTAVQAEWRGLQLSFLIAFWGCLAFDLTNHGIFHFVLWYVLGLGLATAWQILKPGQEPETERPTAPMASPASKQLPVLTHSRQQSH